MSVDMEHTAVSAHLRRMIATVGACLLPAGTMLIVSEPVRAVTPTVSELTQAHKWVQAAFLNQVNVPPFSFRYGGSASAQLLTTWSVSRKTDTPTAQSIRHTLTYTEPLTRLEVKCIATEYTDFPAVEWVVIFRNTGAQDTPILEAVRSADLRVSTTSGDFTVHYADGSHEQITDFQPHELSLGVGKRLDVAPSGGRPSDGVMPFFNVEKPGGGVMLAVGWSGQWAASFYRESASSLVYQAGMEQTHLSLHPGEQIRTPSTLLLSYQGNVIRGHNLLRSLLLHHYTPQTGKQPINPPVAASGATLGFNNVSETNQIQAIHNIAAHKLPVDTYWIDAGWSTGGFPLGMGTWDPDPARFPNGLKPVADAAHQAGLDFLLWCEPERVMPGTWLRLNHPDWLLAPANLPAEVAYQADWRLLNLGNPQALAWAKKTFSGLIGNVGIDVYRQDFNMHPLYYWRANEAADRQGMNEIGHITGLYDYLDTLLAEHPGLLIDDVASGGRRIDLEWLRRSLPLLRTDYLWDPVGAQSMTYALSYWIPVHGQGGVSTDPYDFRSGMGSNAVFAFDFYTAQADFWKPLIARLEEYKPIRHLFSGDFYPLTPYSTANDVWIAWQFDRSDRGEGLVQAFRRADSAVVSGQYRLSGLAPRSLYVVTDANTHTSRQMTGQQLMTQGLEIRLTTPRSGALITYRQLNVRPLPPTPPQPVQRSR